MRISVFIHHYGLIMAWNHKVQQPCLICRDPMSTWMPPFDDGDVIDCPTCGKMHITASAGAILKDNMHKASYVQTLKSRILEAQLTVLKNDWLLIDRHFLSEMTVLSGTAVHRHQELIG